MATNETGTEEAGRFRQRRRTRAAIVAATAELVQAGATPSVGEIADAADVSRRTVYTYFPTLEQLPNWGFDGSSTQQAEGRSSDCVLKPVAVFPDGSRNNGVLVMCEVMMPDGVTPHPSNSRATVIDDPDTWFGFEQEYFLWEDGAPRPQPAINLARLSKGKMIGTRYNKDKEWVGGSVAFFET